VTDDTRVTRFVSWSAGPEPGANEWHGRCFQSEPGDAGLAMVATGASRRKNQS
jgi:hypothetical protein